MMEPESKLREFASCFDESPVALAVLRVIRDGDGAAVDFEYLYANEAYAAIEGAPRSGLEGARYLERYPDAGSKWLKFFGRAASVSIERSTVDFSAELGKFLSVRCFSIGEDCCVALPVDVSRDKRLELDYRRQLSLYRANGRGGVFSFKVDDPLTLVYGNDRFFSLLEYTRESMLASAGNRFASCVHPDDLAEVLEAVKRAADCEGGRFEPDAFRVITGGGRVRFFEASGALEHDPKHGDVISGAMSDVTAYRLAELGYKRSALETGERCRLLEEQRQADEEKHALALEEQRRADEEKHALALEEQRRADEEKHALALEEQRRADEEKHALALEEQRRADEEKHALALEEQRRADEEKHALALEEQRRADEEKHALALEEQRRADEEKHALALEEQMRADEEKHALALEEQRRADEEKHVLALEEQRQADEEKHALALEEQRRADEEKHALALEEQRRADEEKHALALEELKRELEERHTRAMAAVEASAPEHEEVELRELGEVSPFRRSQASLYREPSPPRERRRLRARGYRFYNARKARPRIPAGVDPEELARV